MANELAGVKLLYVEDSPFDRDLTRRALLKQIPGLEWDAVPSVHEAIARADARPLEVLLLDMWLQDGCGLEVLLHVRRRGTSVPVVVVAGSGDEAGVIQFLKAGAQDYQPPSAAITWNTLARACRRHNSAFARTFGHVRC